MEWLIWPIIVILLVVFLIWSEYGSQDCRYQNCNNRAQIIDHDDDLGSAIDKIKHNVYLNHTLVGWRRALLAAILLTVITLFIFCPEMPDGFTVIIVTVIFFVFIYFSSAWIQHRWWRNNDRKLDKALDQYGRRYRPK